LDASRNTQCINVVADRLSSRVTGSDHWPLIAGTAWASITLLIWSTWPAYTRLAVSEIVTPEDLVLLRYGIGGLVLLPVLVIQAPRMPRTGWREGILLAGFQGAPLALLTTIGLQWAPANHLAALSPSLMPIFVAMIGWVFFRERTSTLGMFGLALIALGAVAIVGTSLSTFLSGAWKGDLLFITACFMGSIYAIRMRRSGLSAVQGAALISVYSMALYVPLYGWLWSGSSRLMSVPFREILFQGFYQGVLMGALTLYSLSRSIVLLGAARGAALMSLGPVLGTALAFIILHEIPSTVEIAAVTAISFGVLFSTGAFERSVAKPAPDGH
jgi:drug/metabolite transporter (DMT)-like permease